MGARLIVVAVMSLALAGCMGGGCAGWSMIRPSSKDKLTDGTARQILAHNLQGVRQSCWRPPS